MVVVVEKSNTYGGNIDVLLSKFTVCEKEELKNKDLSSFAHPVYTENLLILSEAIKIKSLFGED